MNKICSSDNLIKDMKIKISQNTFGYVLSDVSDNKTLENTKNFYRSCFNENEVIEIIGQENFNTYKNVGKDIFNVPQIQIAIFDCRYRTKKIISDNWFLMNVKY